MTAIPDLNDAAYHQHFKLPDGRTMGFAAFGDQQGIPVFYLTGGNSSRLEGMWFNKAATQQGIFLIAPDRPGFGLSDFQPNRTLLNWADDITALTQHLEIDKFGVFGLSGGGPHTLALTYRIPHKITRAAVVSGTAPPEMPDRFQGMWFPVRMIFWMARYLPTFNQTALKQMGKFYANPDEMRKRMLQALPKPDRELLNREPEIISIFSAAAQEAHRNGIQGDSWEWRLYVNSWGFRLSDITIPVRLWYGQFDQNVPVGMGRYLAEQLPNSTLTIVPDGGHFSTINNHIGAIFEYLKS